MALSAATESLIAANENGKGENNSIRVRVKMASKATFSYPWSGCVKGKQSGCLAETIAFSAVSRFTGVPTTGKVIRFKRDTLGILKNGHREKVHTCTNNTKQKLNVSKITEYSLSGKRSTPNFMVNLQVEGL